MGWMRRPRTTGELREVAGVGDDVPGFRAKRGNIPDAWEDKAVGRERSWKRHRKTQYKA